MSEILNPQLLLATEFVEKTNRNVFLTGKAGTGKTTFLKNLRQKTYKRLVVVAPTGVAAINAGGVTIHSFFQLSFGPQLPFNAGSNAEERGIKKFNKERINILRSLDLLVIDEISMVRADVLDAIDSVLRHYRDKSKPFGGVQLLMIGDVHQLAPVVKEDEWELLRKYYTTMYFFGSKALNQVSYISIELKFIYRQNDRIFIDLLNKIRENQIDQESIQLLKQRYMPDFDPPEDQGYIHLTSHNNAANTTNTSKLERLQGKSYKFKAIIKDDFPEFIYPTHPELELKIGAQVMFVKNDSRPEKLYYNGKIGIIKRIEDGLIYVKCPSDHAEIEVGLEEWQNMRYSLDEQTKEIKETIIGTFTQYPLKLAWAITIHKSQGLTFDHAIIDAQSSFAHGQVYVALSRCRTLEGLVLKSMIFEKSIISDGSVLDYTKGIENNTPNQEELDKSKLDFQQALLLELFDFQNILIPIYQSIKHARENEVNLGTELLKQLININDKAKLEITEVAEKFRMQIQRLVRQEGQIENNSTIQERINKGCVYFLEKIETILYQPLEALQVDTDNKQVRNTFLDLLSKFRIEYQKKKQCLCICQNSFDVKVYMKTRALQEIDMQNEKIRGAKKSKSPKNIENAELYDLIKDWRDSKANEYNVPEYQILPKKTIQELTKFLPSSLSDLKKVKGIGTIKAKEFGAELIEIISKFCNENSIAQKTITHEEIQKPEKPNTRQISFELYKTGKSVEDIAKERDMAVSTIEGHLAFFVESGEIPIQELVDEYKIKLISAYYKKYENGSLSEAKAALSDDIEWGELKYVVKHLNFLKSTQNINSAI